MSHPTDPSAPGSAAGRPVTLFYSYAHEDEPLRDELSGHLKILERRGLIQPWHDRQITAGQDWHAAIDGNLALSDLVLLLVSADFIGSDYIFGVELKQAMARQAARECEVVPIIVRPVNIDPADIDVLPFMKLQALPADLKPVTTWPNRDEAWTQVAKGLRATVEAIRARQPPTAGESAATAATQAPATRSAPPVAPVPAPAAAPAVAGDPMLDRVVSGYLAQVNAAQQQRGGPPLYDHHMYLAQQGAQALIDFKNPMRVLWVDDHPGNNLNERALLAHLQIEVVCVTSTAEAMRRLAADDQVGEPFNLVLSDWARPAEGRDAGLQLLKAMRLAGHPQPVVIYHGDFDPASRAHKAQLAAAAGVLGEAVMPNELMALVQQALMAPRPGN